jgi:hypothetical protein
MEKMERMYCLLDRKAMCHERKPNGLYQLSLAANHRVYLATAVSMLSGYPRRDRWFSRNLGVRRGIETIARAAAQSVHLSWLDLGQTTPQPHGK